MLQRQIHGRADESNLDTEAILRYVVLEEAEDSKEEIITATEGSLENILKSHENKKAEISSKVSDEEASEMFEDFLEQVVEEQRKVRVVYYQTMEYPEDDSKNLYIIEDKEEHVDYLFVPRGISVNRVPQYVLGANVLGRTWLGSGYIEILDTLYGDSFQEVLQHEINHLLYPHESEREIRDRTRRQIQNPVFH